MKLKESDINIFKDKLIISCQAFDDEPFNDVHGITLMAKAVLEGGATCLRLAQKDHIAAIKKITDVPMMGLIKADYEGSEVFITPTLKEVKELLDLKITCIALDATNRKRPKETLEEIVAYIRTNSPQTLLMADCGSINDVIRANQLGFDCLGTTLVGRTKESLGLNNIDHHYQFIKDCLANSKIPVIAEGGIWSIKEVNDLFNLGVFAVVVGSVITRPKEITKRWLKGVIIK
ncbi:MAG: N-acetylmannosamine-6-phosphate 2-epimerase [Mycoplasmoidaceae bacterium]